MRLKSGAPLGHRYVRCSYAISLYIGTVVMTPGRDHARHDLPGPGTGCTRRKGNARYEAIPRVPSRTPTMSIWQGLAFLK